MQMEEKLPYIPYDTLLHIVDNLTIYQIRAFLETNKELSRYLIDPRFLKHISDTKHRQYVSKFSDLFAMTNTTELYKLAVQVGDMRLVEYYYDKIKVPKYLNKYMYLAVVYGHIDIVRYMFEHGANTDQISTVFAYTVNNEEMIQFLKDKLIEEIGVKKFKYLYGDGKYVGMTILKNLSDPKKIYKISLELNIPEILVSTAHVEGEPFTEQIIRHAPYETLAKIVDNINIYDTVWIAVEINDLDKVKLLIDNGAKSDKNALIIAAENQDTEMIKYLISHNRSKSDIEDAIIVSFGSGNLEGGEYLLQFISKDNIKDLLEDELVKISANGHLDVIKYIVNNKYCSQRDIVRVLDAAIKHDKLDIVKYIINDLKIKPYHKHVLKAIKRNNLHIVKILTKGFIRENDRKEYIELAKDLRRYDIARYFMYNVKVKK